MFIPCQESILKMTPTEFEKHSLYILSEQINNLGNCTFQHNKIIEVDDGNYQIDGYIEFEFMGIAYKTIVECKHYKSSIAREKVAVLYDKIRACGAHKGILISSSNFQSGAIQYASKHGIALIQLTDSGSSYETRTIFGSPNLSKKPNNEGHFYVGVMQTSNDDKINCSYLSRTNLTLKSFLSSIAY